MDNVKAAGLAEIAWHRLEKEIEEKVSQRDFEIESFFHVIFKRGFYEGIIAAIEEK